MNTATVAIVRLDRASSSTGSRLRTGSGGGARAAWIWSGATPAPCRVCWVLTARDAPCTSRLSCSSTSPLATSWRPSTTARSRSPSRTAVSASAALAGCRTRMLTPTASPWAVRAGPSGWEAAPTRPDVELLVVGPEQLGQEDDGAQDGQGDQGGDDERAVAPGPLDHLAPGRQLDAVEGPRRVVTHSCTTCRNSWARDGWTSLNRVTRPAARA